MRTTLDDSVNTALATDRQHLAMGLTMDIKVEMCFTRVNNTLIRPY